MWDITIADILRGWSKNALQETKNHIPDSFNPADVPHTENGEMQNEGESMIPAARSFKEPESLSECKIISCEACAKMCDILMFSANTGNCFNLEKSNNYIKIICGKVRV